VVSCRSSLYEVGHAEIQKPQVGDLGSHAVKFEVEEGSQRRSEVISGRFNHFLILTFFQPSKRARLSIP